MSGIWPPSDDGSHKLVTELRNMLADILSQVTTADRISTICYLDSGDAEELIMTVKGDTFRVRVDMVENDYVEGVLGSTLIAEIEEALQNE